MHLPPASSFPSPAFITTPAPTLHASVYTPNSRITNAYGRGQVCYHQLTTLHRIFACIGEQVSTSPYQTLMGPVNKKLTALDPAPGTTQHLHFRVHLDSTQHA